MGAAVGYLLDIVLDMIYLSAGWLYEDPSIPVPPVPTLMLGAVSAGLSCHSGLLAHSALYLARNLCAWIAYSAAVVVILSPYAKTSLVKRFAVSFALFVSFTIFSVITWLGGLMGWVSGLIGALVFGGGILVSWHTLLHGFRFGSQGRCRECGYLLKGLPENRCPECGTPFGEQNRVDEERQAYRVPMEGRKVRSRTR